ncbi:MAG: hypothetical protein HQ561_03545 [Desulfobacteraceae bacterium]|nr:hypothetical protein [Desulfobacteraceae bacterium]
MAVLMPPLDFFFNLAEIYLYQTILWALSGDKKQYEPAKSFPEPRVVPIFQLIEPFEVISILAKRGRAITRLQENKNR